jgi:pyruvate ferredoxin oxidoreductase beta subunit
MGLSAISAAMLNTQYNMLVIMYDNESYANTDIQSSGSSPYGVHTSFSPPGKLHNIMQKHWKKNTAPMIAAGHTDCRYVATVVASNAVGTMDKVRRALSIGGPTFIHSLNPCPKGWDFDPKYSQEIGELAVETGIFPLYEIENRKLKFYGKSLHIATGALKRKPVGEYLLRQGRFAHFTEQDIALVQARTDAMWDKWFFPGVIDFAKA